MTPALGVCYYPEHWPETMWASDAAEMAAAGLKYVRIGEFAWSRLEPAPGDIQTGWLLRAMDALHAEGLKVVLGTPTATPPRWLVGQMPDMLNVDAEGRVRKFGSRRHYSFALPSYRRECARIVRVIAEAVRNHPALHMWQIDNEYGCHDSTLSYSEATLAGFRLWLAEKYGTVDALNRAWGNVFWSMDYSRFDEVELPNLTQTEASPPHWLDFRRYSSDQVVAFNKVQLDVIREVTPGVPVTHNYMGGHTSFDHWRIGQDLDLASWDSYPCGQLQVRENSNPFKAGFARQGDPDLQAFHNDLYRAVGKGRFWIMEQQPGPVNWAEHNADPLPGMARLWAAEALAHGAEAVCYFRWRQAPFAQEQMHAGLKRPDNVAAPGLDEARQLARELPSVLPEVATSQADCAIVFDYESDWAWAIQPQSKGFSHFEAVYGQYRQLRKLGLNIDLIPPSASDISAYKLVFVPALFAWSDALKSALTAFTGQIVIGPRSGSKTPDFHIPAALPPDLPQNFLDLKVLRVASLAPDTPVPLAGGGQAVGWLERVETKAEVLLRTADGWPVHCRRGNVHYLAALLDPATQQMLTRQMALGAGLADQILDLPDGLRMRRVGDAAFFFNYGLQTRDLRRLGVAGRFLLDGAVLAPAQVAKVEDFRIETPVT